MVHSLTSTFKPKQSRPLLAGLGLLHSRVRCTVPAPHVTVQMDQSFHSVKPPFTGNKKIISTFFLLWNYEQLTTSCFILRILILPGHGGSKHSLVSCADPAQQSPVLLKQYRVLVWTPLPHDTLHALQADHDV